MFLVTVWGRGASGAALARAGLMVFFVSMIMLCINYYYVSYQEKKRLEGLSNEYLSYLKQSLEIPIWTLDKINAQKIADSYFNNELVATLEITEINYESPTPIQIIELEKQNKICYEIMIESLGH